jgi:hypothetical protein
MTGAFCCLKVTTMKGVKFDFERSVGEAGGLPMYLALRGDLSDPGETLLKLRALQSFDRGAARYAINRTVRCAVRRPLDEVFDDLASLATSRRARPC